MSMVVLRKGGGMVCVAIPEDWDGTAAMLGCEGWEIVEQRDGPPPEFASWVEGQGWVVDEAARDVALETARLNALTPIERQAEAIETAKADILAELKAAGVITANQLSSMQIGKPQT